MSDDEYLHPPHLPRLREHVGMVRWRHSGDGWIAETARGQFVGGDGRTWVVRHYDGVELEYDLEEWAPYK
ncbi:hypothetical protein [Leifsonia sp. fls2-241-R2A-40a]|uniref:hypothetical protein n=1 Tax=Leifsonia sp. fls2-241-R2A-40a TaxID=3040290 RepID=UPI002551A2DE|nr:hypothetical protein [Leifsonia sp. fls2-241-R2A-40a]